MLLQFDQARAEPLFPMSELGVHVGYERIDARYDFADRGVEIGAIWFFRRNVGLDFTFAREVRPAGQRTASARLSGRF
jgi:hypothetical protein